MFFELFMSFVDHLVLKAKGWRIPGLFAQIITHKMSLSIRLIFLLIVIRVEIRRQHSSGVSFWYRYTSHSDDNRNDRRHITFGSLNLNRNHLVSDIASFPRPRILSILIHRDAHTLRWHMSFDFVQSVCEVVDEKIPRPDQRVGRRRIPKETKIKAQTK